MPVGAVEPLLSRPEIEAAAAVARAGIDPMRFLTHRDPLWRLTAVAIAHKYLQAEHDLIRRQAAETANAVARMLGGGR